SFDGSLLVYPCIHFLTETSPTPTIAVFVNYFICGLYEIYGLYDYIPTYCME
ncbi:hypothetical protein ACJX0J_012147, partial [Zea mays]